MACCSFAGRNAARVSSKCSLSAGREPAAVIPVQALGC